MVVDILFEHLLLLLIHWYVSHFEFASLLQNVIMTDWFQWRSEPIR